MFKTYIIKQILYLFLTLLIVGCSGDRDNNDNQSTDTTAPIITIVGEAVIDVLRGSTYIDEGATAIDDVDGDITSLINSNAFDVNTLVSGEYIITYEVYDTAENYASATRTVNVINTNQTAEHIEGWDFELYQIESYENGQPTGSYPTKCFIIWRFDKNINTRTTIADGQNCAYELESYSYTIDQEKVIIEGYTYIFENFVQNQDGVSFSLRGIDSQGQTENVFKFYR